MDRRRLVPAAAAALALLLAVPAAAFPPDVVDTPTGRVAGPAYLAAQYDRGTDQLQHAEYRERLEQARAQCPADDHCHVADPYVAAWTRDNLVVQRGVLPGTEVAYELLRPRQARPGQEPRLPAVVLLPGSLTHKETYRGAAQGLAASGYAVVSVDPACNLGCGPGDPTADAAFLATVVAPVVASCATTGCDYRPLAADYTASEATFQAAGRAALQWLADGGAGRVDVRRVGVVGHSLGAYNAALLAQQPDLPVTVRAAVAWDGYAELPTDVLPRVPVSFHAYEGQDRTPHAVRPDETPATANAERLRAAAVPTQVLALRSSTHQEVAHVPYDLALPTGTGASRSGERVALAGTLAWLDAFLLDGRRAAAARAELTGAVLSDRVDAVSHGQGRPAADGSNVPYAVGGDRWADHLSLLLRSWYDLGGGTACADQQAGCP